MTGDRCVVKLDLPKNSRSCPYGSAIWIQPLLNRGAATGQPYRPNVNKRKNSVEQELSIRQADQRWAVELARVSKDRRCDEMMLVSSLSQKHKCQLPLVGIHSRFLGIQIQDEAAMR